MQIRTYGYFPKPSKSCLIVKDSMIHQASSLFHNLSIDVVTSCHFLGSVIDDISGRNKFISHKIKEWSHHVELLSDLTISQPQATYIALTKSLQQEWNLFTTGCPTLLSLL